MSTTEGAAADTKRPGSNNEVPTAYFLQGPAEHKAVLPTEFALHQHPRAKPASAWIRAKSGQQRGVTITISGQPAASAALQVTLEDKQGVGVKSRMSQFPERRGCG